MGFRKRFELRRVNAIWLGFTWDTSWSNYPIDVTICLPFMQLSIGIGPEHLCHASSSPPRIAARPSGSCSRPKVPLSSTPDQPVFLDDLRLLKHTLGIDLRTPRGKWGYRGHYCAAASDVPALERLAAVGLVKLRETHSELHGGAPLYVATQKAYDLFELGKVGE